MYMYIVKNLHVCTLEPLDTLLLSLTYLSWLHSLPFDAFATPFEQRNLQISVNKQGLTSLYGVRIKSLLERRGLLVTVLIKRKMSLLVKVEISKMNIY